LSGIRSDFFAYGDGSVTDEALVEAIEQTLAANGYDVVVEDAQAGVVIGERGLRTHEWSSVIASYFRRSDGRIELYIENRITQDVTGGPAEDRARNFAGQLCVALGTCSFSPTRHE